MNNMRTLFLLLLIGTQPLIAIEPTTKKNLKQSLNDMKDYRFAAFVAIFGLMSFFGIKQMKKRTLKFRNDCFDNLDKARKEAEKLRAKKELENNQEFFEQAEPFRAQLDLNGKQITYYSILGLEENASDEQIKKAFRALALKFHSDKSDVPGLFDIIKKAYNFALQLNELGNARPNTPTQNMKPPIALISY